VRICEALEGVFRREDVVDLMCRVGCNSVTIIGLARYPKNNIFGM
jgi:hypothetical protein